MGTYNKLINVELQSDIVVGGVINLDLQSEGVNSYSKLLKDFIINCKLNFEPIGKVNTENELR